MAFFKNKHNNPSFPILRKPTYQIVNINDFVLSHIWRGQYAKGI